MRNYRIWLILVFGIMFSQFISAQTYGNEWINYSQKYYSFKIASSGLHKIDYSTLSASGVPLSSFSTLNIQIFGREKEIPLHIEDGGDSSFDPGDYLIFYAEKNDGWLDTTLYESANDLGNPKYSLYNDTIEYFFTWNNLVNNARFVVETDIDYAAYTPSNYILYEKFQSFSSSYNEGEKTSQASSSFFTSGEGWGSAQVDGASGYVWDFSSFTLNDIYQGLDAPDVKYKAVSVGVSNATYTGSGNHHTLHTIGATNTVICDSVFTGYRSISIDKSFPVSILPSNGASNYKVSIVGDQGAVTDYQSLNYYSFTYPRNPDLGGSNKEVFRVNNNVLESKIRLDLSNISVIDPLVFVLGDVPRKVGLTANGAAYSLLFPNSMSGVVQTVIYQENSTINNIGNLSAVNMTGTFNDYTTFNPDSALLMVYHPKLEQASKDYKNYRQGAGGAYHVVLANIEELYQQYGGGIPKHINGIRRFAHHMYDFSSQKPVGLFLMGKGIREANVFGITSTGPGSRTNATNYAANLIPSFGQPSSDACITSNLPGTTKWVPLIPTGRIAVSTNDELSAYLQKVIEYEQNQEQTSIYDTPNKDWQKQVLHFVGGSNASEQNLFQAYMDNMSNEIVQENYGANILTTIKDNTNPLSPSDLNNIMNRIQNGVSLITFFGHAAATNSGFEINIDEPANWNNQGKYPLVLTNSCYNGNIFQSGLSKSEQFVNVAKSGAIAYMGTVNLGFAHTLYQYSHEFYRQISSVNYGAPIAFQIKSAIANIESSSGNILSESTTLQMALNGDPMLRVNWHQKPEIELRAENIRFLPEELDLDVDSIEIQIDIKNLGRSITDTFMVEITRDFPGSTTDSVYKIFLPELDYLKTISFKMPMQPNIGMGLNTFSIKADLPSFIEEQYDEVNNNQISKTLFIDVDGIQPVLPYEFAVVPDPLVTLKASTINPIADFNTYRFEIDTIDFEGTPSPFHRYAMVSGLGGVKEVDPSAWILSASGSSAPLLCSDSTVYFWRVSVQGTNPIWRESSFQYITNKTGWGQDHFYQFKNNGFDGVLYQRPTRHRMFGPNIKKLKCVAKATYSIPGIYYNEYLIDMQSQEYGICTYTPSLYVAVINPYTLKPWGTNYNGQNPSNNFGNVMGCRGRVEKYFIFRQNDAVQLQNFQNMMAAIPDSHYILVYSPMTTLYDQWDALSPSIYTTFQSLGSDSIVSGRVNRPFAFFCRKGNDNSVVELFAQNPGEDVILEADLIGFDYNGQETSPLIGPSSQWGNVYWKQDSLEVVHADTTILSIKAFDQAGAYQTTYTTAFTKNDSLINLNAIVDATQYPYIQLEAKYKDSVSFTPAQLDRWHVLFNPLPEAAIDGTTAYTWLPSKDTLEEGQMVDFAVDIKNIYNIDMDSLLVKYWVTDANQINHSIQYNRQDSLRVGQTFRDTIRFSTLGLAGINSFWMEVNPYVNGSSYITDQPEQKHFNNILQIPFYVNGDDINPILDVTFNGRRLLNGDIVAPTSEILISLKDENPYLVMDNISDTTLFGVYLTDPDGIQRKIPFMDANGNTIMQWVPADGQSKRFKIVYPTYFSKNGTYTLFVQGSDRSGNLSGDLEYKINFEVIHESAISYMMNYPNPFSTSTRFVFTLTGDRVPDDILIQIMTISGKVVKEIDETELGVIQIGRNVTDYSWDGKDNFGDPLANGVYLYRVVAQIDGENIKHLETGADQHMDKEFGKMYLMR